MLGPWKLCMNTKNLARHTERPHLAQRGDHALDVFVYSPQFFRRRRDDASDAVLKTSHASIAATAATSRHGSGECLVNIS